MILCVRKRKNNYLCTQLGRADDHGTVCSDTDGTDCSASMVPITVLHLVPIQRYQQERKDAECVKLLPALESYQPLLGTEHVIDCKMLIADGTDIPKVENSLTN